MQICLSDPTAFYQNGLEVTSTDGTNTYHYNCNNCLQQNSTLYWYNPSLAGSTLPNGVVRNYTDLVSVCSRYSPLSILS